MRQLCSGQPLFHLLRTASRIGIGLHGFASEKGFNRIYVNPADTEYPIGFNVFYNTNPKQRHLIASGIIQAFKKIWMEAWGPRLEYVFRNAILALLEQPGNTLLGIPRLLTDDRYRMRLLASVKDPVIKHFWEVEYEQYPKVFRTETISPIQNKVGQFLANPLMRNILGQTKTKFDLLDVMDSGKILLVNLAKGKIGEDTARLLGALLLTHLYTAALRRANIPEHTRRPFFLYADEAQDIATQDFASILAEARKYGLNIAGMANQFMAQLSQPVSSAILGNIGTLIAFACGSDDAEHLAREFYPTFTANNLQNLPQYEMYLKLSIDGKTSEPFSAETVPPFPPSHPSHKAIIIAQSRMRYAQPQRSIEQKIQQWLLRI